MTSPVIYCLDSRDAIESVAGAWDSFAEENGAPELCAEKVLGRPLAEFVAGFALQRLWSRLLARVRDEGRRLTVPFRCDSPDQRRFMELDLTPLDRGRVEHRSRLLRAEPRERVALLQAGVPRTPLALSMCSMCDRIEDPVEGWVEAEQAVVLLGLLEARRQPRLAHGLCDSCAASLDRAAAG